MDQYPFVFTIAIAGMNVLEFIDLLKNAGYETQAKTVEMQFDKQIEELQPTTSPECVKSSVVGQSEQLCQHKYQDIRYGTSRCVICGEEEQSF